MFVLFLFILRWAALQSIPRPRRRPDGEKKTAKDKNDIYVRPVERAREGIPGDPLPRHIHQRRNSNENRPDGGQSAG